MNAVYAVWTFFLIFLFLISLKGDIIKLLKSYNCMLTRMLAFFKRYVRRMDVKTTLCAYKNRVNTRRYWTSIQCLLYVMDVR